MRGEWINRKIETEGDWMLDGWVDVQLYKLDRSIIRERERERETIVREMD